VHVFERACRMGLEGIVSKRKGSRYRSGRTLDWMKATNPNAPAVTRAAKEDWCAPAKPKFPAWALSSPAVLVQERGKEKRKKPWQLWCLPRPPQSGPGRRLDLIAKKIAMFRLWRRENLP
jgi:hypothetical protein